MAELSRRDTLRAAAWTAPAIAVAAAVPAAATSGQNGNVVVLTAAQIAQNIVVTFMVDKPLSAPVDSSMFYFEPQVSLFQKQNPATVAPSETQTNMWYVDLYFSQTLYSIGKLTITLPGFNPMAINLPYSG